MASDRRVTTGRRWGRVAAAALAVALWAAAYGWPVAAIVGRSVDGVAGRAGLSMDTVSSVLGDARVGRLALWSVAQCAASTALVTLIGVPMGWVVGRLRFRGRRVLSATVMTPFVLPTLTIAGAMIALAGGVPDSTAARFALIVGAHVTFNLGLMVRSVSAAVSAVPPELEQVATTLGRPQWRAVGSTTLSVIRPAVASAAVVVAVFCLTSFGVIVALGGAAIGTVEVEVWYLTTRTLDLGRAAVLAGLQLVVVLALVVAYQRIRRPATGRAAHPLRSARSTFERSAVAMTYAVAALVSAAPLVALVVRSLRNPDGWTFDHYRVLGGEGAGAIGYSLAAAVVATVVAIVLAVPLVAAANRDDRIGRWFEGVMVVPLALSAATLGLGFLVAFSGPTLDLRGTWIVVPLVQGASAAPVVVRIVLTAARGVDRSLLDAAAVGGAGPWRRGVTVVWPALRRPLGVATGFAFAMAVGEFGATVFLSRTARPTVPTLIGRLLGRPGSENLGQALALSCVLGLIAAVSVLLVDRASGDGPAF